jgi:succinate dehydrogenase/fumarate reductase flavoprotein subunit
MARGGPGPGAVADVKTTVAPGVVGGLTDALVFGRIAGAQAAARISRRASPSS